MNINFSKTMPILMSCIALFSSCSDSDDTIKQNVNSGEIALYLRSDDMEGQGGTGYLQLIGGLTDETQNISNSNALQAPYGAPPEYYGNDIFVLPGLGSDALPYMTKYTRQEDGTLIETGKMKMPVNCYSSSIAFAGPTKGYVNSWLGYIYEFNPQTMTMTTKIDISGHRAEGVSSPLLGGLFVHNGYLYASVIQCQSTFAPATAPAAEMSIINTKDNKEENYIKETESGISYGTYQYSHPSFADENGDLYFVCSGAYGMMDSYKSGILRIKKGTKEFDQSYKFSINDTEISDDGNKGVWLEYSLYNGNGKLYGLIDVPAHRKDPATCDWFNDRSLVAVEIDIYKKTIKKLDIPFSGSYSTAIEKYKNLIVFSNISQNANGFYTYNPENGEIKYALHVSGTPSGFHYFGK